MNVEGTYIDGAEWALYCGNCGKPTPKWASPDRVHDGSTIECYNCGAEYTISIDVSEAEA